MLDYDDVGMDGHPSAALTPAILAEGWTLGSSGEEALAAYVAGYEVWALLQELEPGALHERGFHPTAIWGTLSAAAACARLNHLNAERDHQRDRDRGLARGRHGGEFRHHDQVAACRAHRAIRRAGGAAGEIRLHRLARRAGAQGRLHARAHGMPAIRR